jgi:mono/diheme cytochrome c family protein
MTRKSLRRVVTAGLALSGLMAVTSIASAAGDAAKGEQLYTSQKCSMCHSIAGKGNKKYPLDGIGGKLNAADLHEWLVNPDAQIAKKAEKPVMKMKSYKSLSTDDLDSLVAYLQTLK